LIFVPVTPHHIFVFIKHGAVEYAYILQKKLQKKIIILTKIVKMKQYINNDV
jgi:hypothetical protein